MSYLDMLLEEVSSAEQIATTFATMSNGEFVNAVREAERRNPSFMSLVNWRTDVDRELNLRLLLKPLI